MLKYLFKKWKQHVLYIILQNKLFEQSHSFVLVHISISYNIQYLCKYNNSMRTNK